MNLLRPNNVSRRGFLRALGLTACTVLMNPSGLLVAEKEMIEVFNVSCSFRKDGDNLIYEGSDIISREIVRKTWNIALEKNKTLITFTTNISQEQAGAKL